MGATPFFSEGWWEGLSETMVGAMDRRGIHVQVAGQRYKVVSTVPESELTRLAAAVDAKVAELTPRGRQAAAQSVVLAAIALAHELEEERARRQRFEVRVRDMLRRILLRIDKALESTPRPVEEDVKEEGTRFE